MSGLRPLLCMCAIVLGVHGRVFAADGGTAAASTSDPNALEPFLQMLLLGFGANLLVWIIRAFRSLTRARGELLAAGRR
jgi:hypothetical protein